MVDVLLTHSYHLPHDRKQIRKMQPYPPLGTLYAAAVLRERGYSVALFDTMLESPSGFVRALKSTRPRLVAIYEDSFNYLSKMCLGRMREIAFSMIDAARGHGAAVAANGSDSTDHFEDYLLRGADYVLLGEAEWTLGELTESLLGSSGRDARGIAGLAFVDGKTQRAVKTPPRPLNKELDRLPLPARDLVDVDRYRGVWKRAHGFFSLNLAASRGCPYRCNWCARPIYGDQFHVRSAAGVAREMRELRETYGADYLWFADDLFGTQRQWVHDLAARVEEMGAAVPFRMQSRVDLMKEDTVDALRRAGCAEVWMGAESGSQKILDAMDKGIRVGQIRDARRLLLGAGIRACFFLQFGYPGEDWNAILDTVQLVRDTRPDDVGISVSYPLPGTKFYENVRGELGKKTNWDDSEDLAMMFKGAYTSDFYRALHDAIHAEVEGWAGTRDWEFRMRAGGRRPPGETVPPGENTVDRLWMQVEKLRTGSEPQWERG